MDEHHDPDHESWAPSKFLRIDELCDRFETALNAGGRPKVEDFLAAARESEREQLRDELLALERAYKSRFDRGATPTIDGGCDIPSDHRTDVGATRGLLTESFPPRDMVDPATDVSVADAAGEAADGGLAPGKDFGRFELLELLGEGAFGMVFLARDPRLDRCVALKIPHMEGFGDARSEARFLKEARAAAQLRHPYIVPVYETGKVGNTPFISSYFVAGKTLRRKMKDRRLDPRQAAALVGKLASALHYAHSQGIVHRDVKPDNIILDFKGEPQITDFGLARRESGDASQTREGVRLGTLAYMSPEQARGESHLADGRSDLWSLGVILYELLAGQRPFSGEEFETLRQIVQTEPLPPRQIVRSIPKDLETICLKCLAKEREKRYASCQLLADDLRRFESGEPILRGGKTGSCGGSVRRPGGRCSRWSSPPRSLPWRSEGSCLFARSASARWLRSRPRSTVSSTPAIGPPPASMRWTPRSDGWHRWHRNRRRTCASGWPGASPAVSTNK